MATRVQADTWVAPCGMSVRLASDGYSGPRLEYWGGNVKALFRPRFYTHHFPSFPPCRTMFPFDLFFAGHVATSWALDGITSGKAR